MITELSEREYKELTDAAEGQTLDAILCYSVPDIHPAEFSFADRREIFFWALTRLLKEGRIKLAKHGKFWKEVLTSRLSVFDRHFRKQKKRWKTVSGFLMRVVRGAVWVLEDGSLEWT